MPWRRCAFYACLFFTGLSFTLQPLPGRLSATPLAEPGDVLHRWGEQQMLDWAVSGPFRLRFELSGHLQTWIRRHLNHL